MWFFKWLYILVYILIFNTKTDDSPLIRALTQLLLDLYLANMLKKL